VKISKDQYVLRSLSKIKHKKWENFIISRIVHSIIDLDIEFSCQQLVKTKNGKRYLTDLCFPGLKLYLEVDEKHHSSSKNVKKDQDRNREIIDATGFHEKRIRVYDKKSKTDRDLKKVTKDTDKFIKFIKQRKKKFLSRKKFVKWNKVRSLVTAAKQTSWPCILQASKSCRSHSQLKAFRSPVASLKLKSKATAAA